MASITTVRAPAPAVASAVDRLLGLAAVIGRWYHDSRDRRQLASLSDSMLRDVGLSRGDVVRESLKPFWQAVDREALEAARRSRRRPRA
jgi:uncharacterized protein YjiS (DUF1127 family)